MSGGPPEGSHVTPDPGGGRPGGSGFSSIRVGEGVGGFDFTALGVR